MNITLQGKEYTIPENINNIKLKHFKKVAMLDFTNMNPIQYNIEIATILFEESVDFFRSIPIDEFKPVMESFESYKDNKLTEELSDTIIINSETYKRIDINKMTVGEWIDLNDFISKGALLNLDKMLSILFRKEGEPYTETLLERAPLFDELEIGVVYGAIGFFQSLNRI